MVIIFAGDKYATRAIKSKVSLDLQMILWWLIEKRKQRHKEVDYLQVFELDVLASGVQVINHSQEVPTITDVYYYVDFFKPIKTKIWIIDSGEYCTMMFPEDY